MTPARKRGCSRGLCLLVNSVFLSEISAAPTADVSSLKSLSLEELSQIEVTSPTKAPEHVSRVPMAIFVITSDDIRRSGVISIPEALRLAPGVEVARIEGNKWSVGIRGFGSRFARSVLVLMDGRTVYTTLFAGTYWEVQDTVLDDIDRIEVIRGPGGTIWGPNAVNGVINIITRHTRDTHGMLATAAGGNEVQGFLQYRYGGGWGKRLNYRIYGKAFTRSPQHHQDGRNFDDWRSAQTGFRIDWDRSDRDQVTFQGDLYQQEGGQRVRVVSYAPPFTRNVEQNADLAGGNVIARWTRALSSDSSLLVQTFYDRTNRSEANLGETRDTVDLDFIVRDRARRQHRLFWGAGIRTSQGAAREVTSGLIFVPLKRTDYLLTGFIQDEIALVGDQLSLTLGTKLLRTNFAAFQAEPSVRLMWTPTKTHSVWGSFTRAVRTPSRAERDLSGLVHISTAANGTPSFGRINANPDFKTEQMNGFEAGFRHLIGAKLYLDVATFHNRYDDLFSQETTGPPFLERTPEPAHLLLPGQFRNGLYGATSGYEIAPEWRPSESWRLRGSYSYLVMDLHTRTDQDLGTAPMVEGTSPRHRGVVLSAFTLPRNVEVDLTYRYVSSLPGQGVQEYSTGDARIGWRIRPELDISIVGRNLLQPWHLQFGNGPGPSVGIRRAAYVRLTWAR